MAIEPADGRGLRTPALRWTLLVLALGVGLLLVAARPFLDPSDEAPLADGPIVVLGGGGGERLATATRLRGDTSRPLVVSATAIGEWHGDGGSCADADTTCIVPDPMSTLGEALAVRDLARSEGWPHVTVVTSDFHVSRTRLVFERCVDVPVRVVAAPTSPGPGERLYRTGREMAATLVALARRSCS